MSDRRLAPIYQAQTAIKFVVSQGCPHFYRHVDSAVRVEAREHHHLARARAARRPAAP